MSSYVDKALLALGVATSLAHAQITSDMPGSQDHPDIPRVAGTIIVAYAQSTYDAGIFVTGMEDRELQTRTAEGERTRIAYFGPQTLAPLGILRNYQQALANLGQVTEIFSCRDSTCYTNFGEIFIWSDDTRIPSVFENPQWLYSYGRALYRNQSYWYGTAQSAETLYHVSVYTAVRTDGGYSDHQRLLSEGQTLTHIEIVKVEDFTPTLSVVTAAEMSAQIAQTGHVALYGLYFDTDSDQLRSDSQQTLQEIAKTLEADPSLALYVVGHTDNQGTFEYNLSLSESRAASVVRELVANHGVAAERLVPVGVGLAAPVAINDTEDGRSLNRRVELVKR